MGRAGETVLPPMTVVRSIMARRRSGAAAIGVALFVCIIIYSILFVFRAISS